MKTKILSGLICCLGILSANAQTITAPAGQSLTVTNPIDVTVAGGSVNVPSDGGFRIGGGVVLSTKGTQNLFIGDVAGNVNVGSNNAFVGKAAGFTNGAGSGNMFLGPFSGYANTTGSFNTFAGVSAGEGNVTGGNNLFLGTSAGFVNNAGNNSTFVGVNSGRSSTKDLNSFVGFFSAGNISTGQYNSGVGGYSGLNLTSGDFNTFVGYSSGVLVGSSAISNATSIGANATASLSNTVVLGNAATTITGQGLGADLSGLRFANLKSTSPASPGGSNKALSVDVDGNVILVGLIGATTTSVSGPVAENWKEADGYLYNNSTNGVVIKGTGLDGNSLIVKGGVLSKEVNVKVEGSESWPDYVFKPNYKRMTLGEVEKFIAINGHLPNIPSATEMAATGNNLGKTDAKLLEKVEELTLYLLEMKKANDAQAAELKSLKRQVSKLSKK